MLSKDALKRQVCEAIQQRAEAIIHLGETIRHHPELGFKEYRTAALVADTLRELGVPHTAYQRGINRTERFDGAA